MTSTDNPAESNNNNGPATRADTLIIPVIEERLQIDKQWVETGQVHIHKTVTEQAMPYEVALEQEKLVIITVPINQYVATAPPAMRQEGDKTILSVLKEVLVTEKKLLLVEEIHITKTRKVQVEKGLETVRKELVHIVRSAT